MAAETALVSSTPATAYDGRLYDGRDNRINARESPGVYIVMTPGMYVLTNWGKEAAYLEIMRGHTLLPPVNSGHASVTCAGP